MDDEIKIVKTWLDLTEIKLDTFSTSAYKALIVEEDYPDLITEAQALKDAALKYHEDLSNFLQFGGTEFKEIKDASKALVYKAHDMATTKLEMTAAGKPITYITRPGYRQDKSTGRHKTGKVKAPVVKKAESSTVRGQVNFILKAVDRTEVKGIVGRYSLDNGATWIEGLFAFKLNFVVTGMPSGKDVLFQFRFNGTNNREGEWSKIELVQIF